MKEVRNKRIKSFVLALKILGISISIHYEVLPLRDVLSVRQIWQRHESKIYELFHWLLSSPFFKKSREFKMEKIFEFLAWCFYGIFNAFWVSVMAVVRQQTIDPLGRPTVPAGSDHYFCTFFSPYVRPHFSKYRKTNKLRANIMIATGGTVGLAEARLGRGDHWWHMSCSFFFHPI